MVVYILRADCPGDSITVEVAANATVGDLIDTANLAGLPESSQLLFGNQLLNEPRAELSDVGICAEAQLTALPSPFEKNEDFEIKGATATLIPRADMQASTICLKHKTHIGQVTRMKLRLSSWKRVDYCTKDMMSSAPQLHHAGFGPNQQINITMDARSQDSITVKFENQQEGYSDTQPVYAANGWIRWKVAPQFQSCVKMYPKNHRNWNQYGEPAPEIELVDIDCVGLAIPAHENSACCVL